MRTYTTHAGEQAYTGTEEHWDDLQAWVRAADSRMAANWRRERALQQIVDAVAETVKENAMVALDMKADEAIPLADIYQAFRDAAAMLGEDPWA